MFLGLGQLPVEDRLPRPRRGECVAAWRAACEARVRRRQRGMAWGTAPGSTTLGQPGAAPGGRPVELEEECWEESPQALREIARCERAVRGARPLAPPMAAQAMIEQSQRDRYHRQGLFGLSGLGSAYEDNYLADRKAAEQQAREQYAKGVPCVSPAVRIEGPFECVPPSFGGYYTHPRPLLPTDPNDCEAYARFLCEWGKSNRKVNSNTISECDTATVTARCRELAAQASQRVRSYGEQTIGDPVFDAARVARQAAEAAPEQAGLIERATTSDIAAYLRAERTAELVGRAVRFGLIIGAGVAAYLGWRTYRRVRQR